MILIKKQYTVHLTVLEQAKYRAVLLPSVTDK